MSAMGCLGRLCHEELAACFDYLDVDHLMACQGICRTFQVLVSGPLLWYKFLREVLLVPHRDTAAIGTHMHALSVASMQFVSILSHSILE